MKRTAAIFAALLLSFAAASQTLPDCARPDSSRLRFPGGREAFDAFAAKLTEVRRHPDSSITIWHIGGSHVQAGHFSSRLRNNFDSLGLYPVGGRGYIFPYPLAHTNFDHSYTIRGRGEWIGSRSSNPNRDFPGKPRYGITGIAAYTADSLAAFTLAMPYSFGRLRIMGEASDTLVRPFAVCGADTLRFVPDTLLRGYVADFPEPMDSVQVEFALSGGQSFTITGLLPEAPWRKGVCLVSTGVNGARTVTWTDRCPEFERELSLVHPSLVILGLGINDAACPPQDFRPDKFKANYRRLISVIKRQAPDCALVFITNNDSWRYRRRSMTHNDNGAAVRLAMFELAREYGAGVWDLFTIMGGNGSAQEWHDAGLMKPDRLHFTVEGYHLLGDMLYDAIIRECR